jgi:protein SDA1
MIPLFLKLLKCQDKVLRKRLTEIITTDLARMNLKHKNNNVNKKIQNFCQEMMKDPNKKAVRKTVNIMIYLYKKKVISSFKSDLE